MRFLEPAAIEIANRWRMLLQTLLLAVIAAVVCATVFRSISQYHHPKIGEFDRGRLGLFDFHNGIYFPAVALTQGYDPYGPKFAADFPVTRQIPPYSPLALVLHWPLGWLPLRVAEVLYYGLTLGLLVSIGVLSVHALPQVRERATWSLAAVLVVLASRSGHTTLFTGYFTAELVLGTLVALRYAESRPALSGLGIALASIKPNFGIPLILLMAARGNWRATALGIVFSVVGAAMGIGVLLQHVDLATLISDIQSSDSAHVTDDYELPVNTWTRVDLLAVVCKWANANPGAPVALGAMLGLMVVPCIALYRLRGLGDKTGDQSYSGVLILAVGLAALYHHAYDALLLIPAAFSLVLDGRWRVWFSLPSRMVLAVGLMFVPWNYLSAEAVLNRLHFPPAIEQVATSSSGVVLLACCLVLSLRGLRQPGTVWPADHKQ